MIKTMQTFVVKMLDTKIIKIEKYKKQERKYK